MPPPKAVTSSQMREIDQKSEKEFGVSSLQLMENAGRAVADQIIRILSDQLHCPLPESRVIICCGRGNNGGDGVAAARNLKKTGVSVKVYCLAPVEKKPVKQELKTQLAKAKAEGVEITMIKTPEEMTADLGKASLIVDALLGTGSKGKPMGPVHKVIQKIMKAGPRIVALDIPSGIDADTGYHSGVFIKADWTLTLGLPKIGLMKPHAQRYVGELITVDIGHPKKLLERYQ
ncbi:MAG: NAD(P)H-hydrate epimerase [Elusimicrobia bacterium]|nr:NAD(P)H-hydrate epimerase [Elusimicrobiota bacterium]